MKFITKNSLLSLIALGFAVVSCETDDELLVRNFCRFRIGIFPHPNPILCYKYVNCVVSSSIDVAKVYQAIIFSYFYSGLMEVFTFVHPEKYFMMNLKNVFQEII